MITTHEIIDASLTELARMQPNITDVWANATAEKPPHARAFGRIACITPVHNRRAHTIVALASLFHAIPLGVEVRVYVVDDGSNDDTRQAISCCFPQVIVLEGDGSLYYSEGVNTGVRAALLWNPDYVLFFNNDQIFHWCSISHLLKSAGGESVVGGILLLWNRPTEVFQIAQYWSAWFGGYRQYKGLHIDDFPETPVTVQALSGNCVMAPVAAVREAGLMDSRHLPMFGDTEYFMRMARAGWPLLVEPRARIWCEPNRVHRLRDQAPTQLLRQLFLERMHYNHIGHNFRRIVYSAPTRWQGFCGATVFFSRLALKAIGLGGRWPDWPNPPLYWQNTKLPYR